MAVAYGAQRGRGRCANLCVAVVQQRDQRVHAVVAADLAGCVDRHQADVLVLVLKKADDTGGVLLLNGVLNLLVLASKQHGFVPPLFYTGEQATLWEPFLFVLSGKITPEL